MRKKQALIYFIAGALVLVLGFVVNLWLIEPDELQNPKIKLLIASAISDEATFNTAARAAGFQHSPDVKGIIDSLKRIDANNVSSDGWAVETTTSVTNVTPVVVMAFSGGKNVFAVTTKGARPDVATALKLSDVAAKNVAFSGWLKCSSGQKLIFAGATTNGGYNIFGIFNCP